MNRFLLLFISILLLFILRPFLESFVVLRVLMTIFVTFVLLTVLYAVSWNRGVFVVLSVIGFPTLILEWLGVFVNQPMLQVTGKAFGMIFFACSVFIVLSFLFREREVTGDVIMGAVCGYFLLGFMWAFAYTLLEIVLPASFRLPHDVVRGTSTFTYYSFITLTTLGYGDITPLSSPARSLSLLEAVIGQMYLAVLIARLVGVHLSQSLDAGRQN